MFLGMSRTFKTAEKGGEIILSSFLFWLPDKAYAMFKN